MRFKNYIILSVIGLAFLWPIKTFAFNLSLDCPDNITSETFDCDLIFVPGVETIESIDANIALTNISDYTFVNTNPTDVNIVDVTADSFSLAFLNNITEQKDIGMLKFTITDVNQNVAVTISNILGNGNISSPDVTKAYNVVQETPVVSDATLSSLTFSGYDLKFTSATENYTLNINDAKTLTFAYSATNAASTVAVTQDGNAITSNSVTVNSNSTLRFTVTNGTTTKTYTVNVVINTSGNPKTGLSISGYIIIMVILMISGTYLIISRGNGIEKTK